MLLAHTHICRYGIIVERSDNDARFSAGALCMLCVVINIVIRACKDYAFVVPVVIGAEKVRSQAGWETTKLST